MERGWTIISGLSMIAAAVLLWRAHVDAAFVAATLGVVAWFLSLRERLRKTTMTTNDTTKHDDSGDENES